MIFSCHDSAAGWGKLIHRKAFQPSMTSVAESTVGCIEVSLLNQQLKEARERAVFLEAENTKHETVYRALQDRVDLMRDRRERIKVLCESLTADIAALHRAEDYLGL